MSNEKLEQTNEKFDKAVNKLAAVLGDKKHLKASSKVGGKAVAAVVQELIAEREQEAQAKVKDGLRKALDGYVALEKELKAKRDELNKLEIQKKEEYIKTIEELSKQIEGIDELAAAYTRGLAQPEAIAKQD